MYIGTYEIKSVNFRAEIYHNRADVFYSEHEPKTYFYYENIGEILADYGLQDYEDEIQFN